MATYSVNCVVKIPRTQSLCFQTVQFMLCENNWGHYGLKVIFVGLRVTLYHYYHYAGESIERMECLQVHILSNMCPRLTIFPRLSFVQYMGLSGFSLPISLRMIVRMFALHLVIITKSEIWIIDRSLRPGLETMIYGVYRDLFCLFVCFQIGRLQRMELQCFRVSS